MAENKTKKNENSVNEFIAGLEDEARLQDAEKLLKIFKKASGEEPKMWGGGIIGFGDLHYKYASGREGDWFMIGFSPRKYNTTIYLMDSYDLKAHQSLLDKLGEYKSGKSCLYIKTLDVVDTGVLESIIKNSVKRVRNGAYLSS